MPTVASSSKFVCPIYLRSVLSKKAIRQKVSKNLLHSKPRTLNLLKQKQWSRWQFLDLFMTCGRVRRLNTSFYLRLMKQHLLYFLINQFWLLGKKKGWQQLVQLAHAHGRHLIDQILDWPNPLGFTKGVRFVCLNRYIPVDRKPFGQSKIRSIRVLQCSHLLYIFGRRVLSFSPSWNPRVGGR